MIGSGETQLGFIDSLKIGNLVYRNFWTLISPNNKIIFNDTIIVKVDAVLGRHFMDEVGEFQILSTENKLLFPTSPTSPAKKNNMLLINGQPYIEVTINGKKSPIHLDTGGSITLYSTFYEQNKEWIKQNGIKDSLGIAGFGGNKKLPIYLLPTLNMNLINIPVSIENVPVLITDEITIKGGDEMIGMDVLSRFYKVIINFNEMSLIIERL